jgi:hypothetical protein
MGRRVTLEQTGYCENCHEDTKLRRDPVDVPHERLVADDRWETCLGCHDFHGNHMVTTEKTLRDAIVAARVRAYFQGGASPYGRERRHEPKRERARG